MPITLYGRRLLNEPTISKELSDIFYGLVPPRSVNMQFSNADGFFTDLLYAGEEFRNKGVKLRRYEPGDDTALTFELYGTITDFNFTDIAEFSISINDPDPLQTLLPQKTYETDDWAEDLPYEKNPSGDLGKPYSICFGHCKKVPLRYIHADFQLIKFLTTHAGGGENEWTRWLIWNNSYVIQSGDYLEYDIYLDENNPGFRQGVEIEGTGWEGRNNNLLDQNGLRNTKGNIESYAKENWYSRNVDLTVVVGNTMTKVFADNENNAGGDYIAYYKRIRITDGAGTTRLTIWNDGAFDTDQLGSQNGASNYSIALAKFFDYIIGYGAIESNEGNKSTTVAVYRNKVVVGYSEYRVYDGSQAIYNGYAFIRFTLEQRDFSGNLYNLHADIRGLEMGGSTTQRNLARVIQNILSDTTWGLGLTINTAFFDTAASDLDSIGNMYCDGQIDSQRKAQDVLNKLLFISRGKLEKNESGEWELSIDTYQSIVKASFGSGDNYFENITKILEYKKTSTKEAIKKFTFNYRFNPWESKYVLKNERTIFSFGRDQESESKFTRDHTTADQVTSYQMALMQQGDTKLRVEVGMEGRNLAIRNSVKVIIPRLKIDRVFQVRSISKKLTSFELELISYNSTIYDYVVGDIPSDENPDDETDYSNTPPDTPTNFTNDSEGTYQSSDGTTFAYFILSADAPTVNFAEIKFGYRKNGETEYTYLSGEEGTAPEWKGRIDGLVPGISYDLVAKAENSYGKRSAGAALTAQIAPGDTTAPATPTGLIARAGLKTITLDWYDNNEDDFSHYELWRNASNDSGTAYRIAKLDASRYTDGDAGFSLYYYWIKAVDYTGNTSGFSSVVSKAALQARTGDIYNGAITTPKVTDSQINYHKRQLVEEQSSGFSIPGGGYEWRTFTHNFGRKVNFSVWLNSFSMAIWVRVTAYANTTNNIEVALVNTEAGNNSGTLFIAYW